MDPNAYAYSIGGGVAYACPACHWDAVTEGRDPEDVPDFNPVTILAESFDLETCAGCGTSLPEKED